MSSKPLSDPLSNVKPVVIIGAPRSGTNMLRDILTSFSGVDTWPCDEINYIWRHGNIHHPSDQFSAAMATPAIRSYIRRKFAWVAQHYEAHTVVEKTCANSLRVEFVRRVLPDAKFIFIYRDGLDVVGSAMKRWKAELEFGYLLKKARFVPKTDMLYYASHFVSNRVYRLFSKERRLAFWGPKLEEMPELLAQHSLEEVCAIQWQRCVELAKESLDGMPQESCFSICYESFVRDPESGVRQLLDFLCLQPEEEQIAASIEKVSDVSVGKGWLALDPETTQKLEKLIRSTRKRLGYE